MAIDNSFSWTPKQLTPNSLEHLNVLVVGGTSGLGREISKKLAGSGAQVTVVGQNFKDAAEANISFVKGDLGSIKNATKLAKGLNVSNTDIVLFTTGIFSAPKREETAEGLERDMATSYLNRIAILDVIVPQLPKKKNSLGFIPRVFNMAYPGDGQLGTIDDLNSEKKYAALKAHMNTVAGNESIVYDYNAKYSNVNFYGLNPGLIKTDIRNNYLGEHSWTSTIVETVIGWLNKTPEQYAAVVTPLLVAPELETRSGGIFNNKAKALVRSKGLTDEYAKQFLQASRDLLKSKGL